MKAQASDVAEYDTEGICRFLKEHRLPEADVSVLHEAGFVGTFFVEWEREDYESLSGLGKAAIVQILRIKRELLPKKDDAEESLRKGKRTRHITPRSFGKPVPDGFFYEEGGCLPEETGGGGSIFEVAREFKRLDISVRSKQEIEKAFVEKVGKFLIGCLNARTNGTLYLGVSDNHSNNSQHGQVIGNDLPPDMRDRFQGYLTSYFKGKAPKYISGVEQEIKDALHACTHPLRFVPVCQVSKLCETVEHSKFVMEVDIEPDSSTCKELLFYMMRQDSHRKRKRVSGKDVKIYFLREGTDTNSYSSNDIGAFKEFQNRAKVLIARRKEQEIFKRESEPTINDKLDILLCRNRSSGTIDDQEFCFVLLCDVANQEDQVFQWVRCIEWHLIIETVSAGQKGLHVHFTSEGDFQSKSIFSMPARDLPHQFKQSTGTPGVASFFSELPLGEKSVLLTTSRDEGNWFHEEHKGLHALISNAFDKVVFDRVHQIVLVILIDEDSNLERVGKILDTFCHKIASKQVAILANDISILKQMTNSQKTVLGPNCQNLMACTTWKNLHDYVSRKMSKDSHSEEKIPDSSGGEITIPSKVLDRFRKDGFDILAANQCEREYLSLSPQDRRAYVQNVNKDIIDFLRGGSPSWRVFYVSDTSKAGIPDILPGLVDRDVRSRIQREISESVKLQELVTTVFLKKIEHQPGSGATTVCRHILWELRRQMRCLALDANTLLVDRQVNHENVQKMAGRILNYRAIGEEESLVQADQASRCCCPVLVLLDNASNVLAKTLAAQVEEQVMKRGITSNRVMIIIIYLVSSFNLERDLEDSLMLDEQGNKVMEERVNATWKLELKLSLSEREVFQRRLAQLKNREEVKPEDMLSFVIMAQIKDNENESPYVKHVIESALLDLDRDAERRLLLYLAILKRFANGSLPERVCYQLAFSTMQPTTKRWNSLSQQSKRFLTVKKQNSRKIVGTGSVLEVLHKPVAFQLMSHLLNGKKVEDPVKEILESAVIMDEAFMQDHTHFMLRNLLLKKSSGVNENADHYTDSKFSQLILQVIRETGSDAAKALLTKGYKKFRDGDAKAQVAQTIARIQSQKEDPSFEALRDAKEWAKTAVQLRPEVFQMHDTLGHVLKHELRMRLKGIEMPDGRIHLQDGGLLLNTAKEAAEAFKSAQELYEENKKQYLLNQDEDFLSASSTNNPSLLGEAAVNMEVVTFILSTQDLQAEAKKNEFLRILRGDIEVDIRMLFDTPENFEWHKYASFISGLFERTDKCVRMMTKKLGYVDLNDMSKEGLRWLKAIEKSADKFEETFRPSDCNWRRDIGRGNLSNEQKIIRLRRYVKTKLANNFGWLLRKSSDVAELTNLQDIMRKMRDLSRSKKECPETGMENEDKISLVNVTFALVHKQADRISTSWQELQDLCKELVQDEVKQPEPYFFSLIFDWPSTSQYFSSRQCSKLNSYMTKLAELRMTYTHPKVGTGFSSGRPRNPIFFASDGAKANKIIPGHDQYKSRRATFKGYLLLPGNFVEISFARERHEFKSPSAEAKKEDTKIKVEIANPKQFVFGYRKKVTCTIGFTMSGPLAYDVQAADDTLREMEHIRQELAGSIHAARVEETNQ